ncbi:nectin 1a-like isoform 2-T2 [Polymixia lowei]
MVSGEVPLLLTVMVIFRKGHSELIRTRRSVTATVGEDAHFNCQLTQFKDVLQVTWQKLLPGRVENLASYNKLIGTRINPPFLGKVELEDAGLQNNSLVLRSVTKQDECCYRCMFNTFPEGAFTGKTCLKVHEQLEPISHIITESSENVKEVSTTIPDVPQPSFVGTVMTVSVGVAVGVAVGVGVGVVCCVLIGAIIFALLKRRSVRRDVKSRRSRYRLCFDGHV